MARAKGYPTPDNPAVLTMTTRCVTIPDIPEFIALIGGLLFEATRPSFWDELGDMTRDEAAIIMQDALALYDAEEECDLDRTPLGSTVWLPSPTIPAKWHKCDGATLLKSAYPDLYDALPDFQFVQVGTGLDIIILPDLTDRFLYGANSDSEIADVAGTTTHQLTVAELPAHAHSIQPHTHPVPRHASGSGTQMIASVSGSVTTNATSGASALNTTDSKGDNGSHNNMPPYMRGYWIMKVLP